MANNNIPPYSPYADYFKRHPDCSSHDIQTVASKVGRGPQSPVWFQCDPFQKGNNPELCAFYVDAIEPRIYVWWYNAIQHRAVQWGDVSESCHYTNVMAVDGGNVFVGRALKSALEGIGLSLRIYVETGKDGSAFEVGPVSPATSPIWAAKSK